jgi:hypothetical protein
METKGGEGRANQGLIDICFGVGLSVKTTAWVIGESTGLVWHEWSVRTGLPTPGDPPPSAIRRRAREVQRGWTDDLRQLAEYGCTQRPSSKTVGYRQIERRAVGALAARHGGIVAHRLTAVTENYDGDVGVRRERRGCGDRGKAAAGASPPWRTSSAWDTHAPRCATS